MMPQFTFQNRSTYPDGFIGQTKASPPIVIPSYARNPLCDALHKGMLRCALHDSAGRANAMLRTLHLNVILSYTRNPPDNAPCFAALCMTARHGEVQYCAAASDVIPSYARNPLCDALHKGMLRCALHDSTAPLTQ